MKDMLRYSLGFLFILAVALLVAFAINSQNKERVTFLPANSVLVVNKPLVARPQPFASEIFPYAGTNLVKPADLPEWRSPLLTFPEVKK
jgi:hypothetical protein